MAPNGKNPLAQSGTRAGAAWCTSCVWASIYLAGRLARQRAGSSLIAGWGRTRSI